MSKVCNRNVNLGWKFYWQTTSFWIIISFSVLCLCVYVLWTSVLSIRVAGHSFLSCLYFLFDLFCCIAINLLMDDWFFTALFPHQFILFHLNYLSRLEGVFFSDSWKWPGQIGKALSRSVRFFTLFQSKIKVALNFIWKWNLPYIEPF